MQQVDSSNWLVSNGLGRVGCFGEKCIKIVLPSCFLVLYLYVGIFSLHATITFPGPMGNAIPGSMIEASPL
jgi:hypothetical protein